MTDSIEHDTTESTSMPSRRKVIAGAAAVAWSVPAITLATATPAVAASSIIVITATGSHFSATDPTGINFSLAVSNKGTQPGANVNMTVRVPLTSSGSAPTFSTLTGWTLSGTATSNGTHWVQTYTRASLPVGNSNVSGTVTFAGTASPYARWSGSAFSLTGTVTATNAISANFYPGSIAAVTPSTLTNSTGTSKDYFDRWVPSGDNSNIGNHRRYTAANPALSGNATITKLHAQVSITKNSSGRWQLEPRVKIIHSEWQASSTPTAHTSTHWVWKFETTAPAYAPTSNSGPGPIGPTSLVPFATPAEPWTPPSSRFSVLFWPNASAATDGTSTQNAFTGTVLFTTTSAGSNVTSGPHSYTF